jgi:hypothetical protein
MARLRLYDFEATWWRCKITVEGETLTPAPPFEPYNPFQAYIPYGHATRRDQRSLLYEFLKVNSKDMHAIVAFCERFGVLGPVEEPRGFDDLVLKDSMHKPKALVDLEDWTLGAHLHRKFGEKPLDPTPAMTPLGLDEFHRVQQLLKRVVTWTQQAKQTSHVAVARKARLNLCYVMNYKLRMVRPRLNWDDHAAQLITGWDVRSLEGALYLMLLFDIQSQGNILTCPWCHTMFLGDHPRTVFCSLRCQNAHKAQVFRDKHAARSKKVSRDSPSLREPTHGMVPRKGKPAPVRKVKQ